MKTHLEKLLVNGLEYEIAFTFNHISEPVDIDMVNNISTDFLTQAFINDCEEACIKFLKDESISRKEAIGEAYSDETRGN
jgi:hypothetical protein